MENQRFFSDALLANTAEIVEKSSILKLSSQKMYRETSSQQ